MVDFYIYTSNMPSEDRLRIAQLLGRFDKITKEEFRDKLKALTKEDQDELEIICRRALKTERRDDLAELKSNLKKCFLPSLALLSLLYIISLIF